MISFVWSSKYPFTAGSGGSETYTAGQIRELHRRGIEARIITIGHGLNDGRDDFPDIPFLSLESKEELAELDDLLVYVIYPLAVKTKHQPYAILHCPPPTFQHGDPLYKREAFRDVRLITASKFAAGIWRRYLKTNFSRMPTVYPYADVAFSQAQRTQGRRTGRPQVLFAGRLKNDKGIYTLLAAMFMEDKQEEPPFDLTVTTSGSNTAEGKVLLAMLRKNPYVTIAPAEREPKDMAALMAKHDIVVMPSTAIFWQELFGMVSIETQHAGCRVVASRSGGLPETNLGGVVLVRPDDPKSLANGIATAIAKGPLTARERRQACNEFTIQNSVGSLLKAINYSGYLRKIERSARASSADAMPARIRRPRAGEALSSLSMRNAANRLRPRMSLKPAQAGSSHESKQPRGRADSLAKK
jgi:glycosyltransferase involved in cell wall biosynthesis